MSLRSYSRIRADAKSTRPRIFASSPFHSPMALTLPPWQGSDLPHSHPPLKESNHAIQYPRNELRPLDAGADFDQAVHPVESPDAIEPARVHQRASSRELLAAH